MTDVQTSVDPASLENLHDIIAPGPVPWWPPAPGWYLLAAMLLIASVLLAIRAVFYYRSNRYRREGQKELANLRQLSLDPTSRAAAIAQAGAVLKRVALAAWPREAVADMSGQRWLAFLNESGGGALITAQQARAFTDVLYCREIGMQMSPSEVEELFDVADLWIRRHDRSAPIATGEDPAC